MALSEEDLDGRFAGLGQTLAEGSFNDAATVHNDVVEAFMQFAGLLNEILPEGRWKSLAFTELESASLWAHQAITNK